MLPPLSCHICQLPTVTQYGSSAMLLSAAITLLHQLRWLTVVRPCLYVCCSDATNTILLPMLLRGIFLALSGVLSHLKLNIRHRHCSHDFLLLLASYLRPSSSQIIKTSSYYKCVSSWVSFLDPHQLSVSSSTCLDQDLCRAAAPSKGHLAVLLAP